MDSVKTVGREPTEEMLLAPDDAGVGLYSREVFRRIWRAMWDKAAASPAGAEVVALMDKADNFERAAVLNYRSAERLADRVEDLIAEFGADALPMIGEWIGEWRHARRQMERPVAHDVGRCYDCPPVGYPTDKTRCDACDRSLPDDGTCVRCGAAPRSASGLCATCVDEDAVRAGEVEDDTSQALWRQTLDQERVEPPTPSTDAVRRQARPADEWQSIETAPKDGTHILAIEDFQREDDDGRLYPQDAAVVRWATSRRDEHGGWSGYGLFLESFEPTHWQPLPEPPRALSTPPAGADEGGKNDG